MASVYHILESANMIDVDRLIWRYGRRADLWVGYADMVANFIKRNKLSRVSPDLLPFSGDGPVSIPAPRAGAKSRAVRIRPQPFPGGLLHAHLHFKGHVYEVNETQWKRFSQKLIKDFEKKLDRAETISFENLMGLSDAIMRM